MFGSVDTKFEQVVQLQNWKRNRDQRFCMDSVERRSPD